MGGSIYEGIITWKSSLCALLYPLQLSYSDNGGDGSETWEAYMHDWLIQLNCLTGWDNSRSEAHAIIICAGSWKHTTRPGPHTLTSFTYVEIAVTSTSYVDNHFAKGKHGRLDSWLIRFGFWYIIILDWCGTVGILKSNGGELSLFRSRSHALRRKLNPQFCRIHWFLAGEHGAVACMSLRTLNLT